MDESKRQYLENRRKEYIDERESLIELEWRGGDSFVKTMPTLSAGALGLSLAFLEKLAPKPQLYTLAYIRGTWIAFALSLGLILAGHLASQRSMQKQRDIIDEDWTRQANANPDSNAEPPAGNPAANNVWSPITFWLNVLSLVAFMLGTILLAVFSWLNLSGV